MASVRCGRSRSGAPGPRLRRSVLGEDVIDEAIHRLAVSRTADEGKGDIQGEGRAVKRGEPSALDVGK